MLRRHESGSTSEGESDDNRPANRLRISMLHAMMYSARLAHCMVVNCVCDDEEPILTASIRGATITSISFWRKNIKHTIGARASG